MNSELGTMSQGYVPQKQRTNIPRKPRGRRILKFVLFIVLWGALITSGIYGIHYYMQQLKTDIEENIARQTNERLVQVENEYAQQLEALKESMTVEILELQGQVQTFNELLTFTADIADDRADESNRLYTRLQQLEDHLTELKANLDVLR